MNFKKMLTTFAFSAGLLIATPLLASAHGYINEGRASLCKQGLNTGCGKIIYDTQSLEFVSGYPTGGPADGQIASAGGQFPELDAQTPVRWYKNEIKSGPLTLNWTLTANHATEKWEYYITKKGWDPNKPLTRADFELITTFYDGNKRPDPKTSHTITVPNDRTGYHVILGVWKVGDTINSFYNVVDVNITNSGTVNDVIAPSVPSNVTATVSNGTPVLSWTASTDNVGVAQYAIYRDGVEVATTSSTTWSDSKVIAGQTYKYTIIARDAAGNASTKSVEVTATIPGQPPANTAPTAPGSLHTMKVSDTVVDLMWSASTDDKGVTAYNIFRDGVKIGSTTGTSYLDQSVQASKTYTYAVVAVDAEGLQS
ncbi:MAG: lytic polysaccharide monooxygenase, partial [Bacilli bacterium]